jgi:hypothetical protein
MSKPTKIVSDESSVDANSHLRAQDDEFCRTLRAAIEMGTEFCPTTVCTEPGTQRPVLNYTRPD